MAEGTAQIDSIRVRFYMAQDVTVEESSTRFN